MRRFRKVALSFMIISVPIAVAAAQLFACEWWVISAAKGFKQPRIEETQHELRAIEAERSGAAALARAAGQVAAD